MTATVRFEHDDGGRKVAVKLAAEPTGEARLAHEARMLELAAHPGVVAVLRSGPGMLVTAAVDGSVLADHPPLPVAEVAGLAAAVATILADLHELGVVHGRVDPTHVLVSADGHPVLCGFAEAGAVPAQSPVADIHGWGRLVERLLATAATDDEQPPGADQPARRPRRWRRRPQAPAWLLEAAGPRDGRAVLADVAARARSDDPPSLRVLAAAIHDRVPSARLPAQRPCPDGPADLGTLLRATDGEPRWRPLPVVGALAALALTLAAGAIVLRPRPPAPDAGPDASPAAPARGGDQACPTAREGAGDDAVNVDDGVDVDGDGCADAVAVGSDGVVTVGGVRFEVGRPGDVVVVGDWDCDARATPALLRPDGAVFVFDAWAADGEAVVARHVRSVPGATGLRALPAGGSRRCHRLAADTSGGLRVVLDPGGAA